MSFKQFFGLIFKGFVFRKVLPGILIGLLAAHLNPTEGNDAVTFILSMVVFWAAIGVGHGLAELTAKSEG